MDGDGKSDIVVANAGSNNFSVFRNNPVLIQTSALSSPLQSGAAVNVSFTTSASLNAGNIFTAQLSDANGSFANSVNISGILSGTGSGTISAVIPANTALGYGYRIRVISSNQFYNGYDNGSNLTINQNYNSLDFDGVNDFVNLGAVDGINQIGAMTMEAWVYLDALPAGGNSAVIYFESWNGE